MVGCIIDGDSIAVGIGMYKHNCEVHAQVSINSSAWNRKYLVQHISSDLVIISLGSNDWSATVTGHELELLRSHITARRVIWIIPAIKPTIRSVVESIAHTNGDGTIDLLSVPRGPDHVHPTGSGYDWIAKHTN